MAGKTCPDCGSNSFYVKDPEDQYTISEFDLDNGEIIYTLVEPGADPVKIDNETETFCNRCAWHDRFQTLK